ncbi:MAG: hypothetical protein OXU20_02255 [Myxococcales bacterium]|nr:hypothetical protein [Myxococcales bacterium]
MSRQGGCRSRRLRVLAGQWVWALAAAVAMASRALVTAMERRYRLGTVLSSSGYAVCLRGLLLLSVYRYPDWEGNQFFGGGDFATPPRGRIAVPVPAVTASPPVMAPAPAPAPVPVDASGPVAGSPAEEPIVEEEDVEAAEQGVDDGQDEAWPVDAGVAEADGGSSQPQDAGVADSQ